MSGKEKSSTELNERRYRIALARMIVMIQKSRSLDDMNLLPRYEMLLSDAVAARAKCDDKHSVNSKMLSLYDDEFADCCNFFVYRLVYLKQYSKIDGTIVRVEKVLPDLTEHTDGRVAWSLRAARALAFQNSGKAEEAIALLSRRTPDRKPFAWEAELVEAAFVGACASLRDQGNASASADMARRGLDLMPKNKVLENLLKKAENRR